MVEKTLTMAGSDNEARMLGMDRGKMCSRRLSPPGKGQTAKGCRERSPLPLAWALFLPLSPSWREGERGEAILSCRLSQGERRGVGRNRPAFFYAFPPVRSCSRKRGGEREEGRENNILSVSEGDLERERTHHSSSSSTADAAVVLPLFSTSYEEASLTTPD